MFSEAHVDMRFQTDEGGAGADDAKVGGRLPVGIGIGVVIV